MAIPQWGPVMRVLIAPQEFKGSLTAREAAECMARGVRGVQSSAEITLVPMSDGGAGLVDALLSSRGGEVLVARVHDPLMRAVDAAWALLRNGTAAIEMSAASGLVLLADDELDPMRATTYGTGELILEALARGCSDIIVGVGGSATVDAGAGAIQALGVRLLDADGRELRPGGAALARLERIDVSALDPRLKGTLLRVACDVTNTLCGPKGAAVMFGPQKGARPEDVPTLDAALRHFAGVVRRDRGIEVLSMPGSGAAGGLGAGLTAAAGAALEPGFDLVARAVGLDAEVEAADIVITGEGRLDAQTAYGKTVEGVARTARRYGKPVGVIAGLVELGDSSGAALFDVVEQATPSDMDTASAMANAPSLVSAAAGRALYALARASQRRR